MAHSSYSAFQLLTVQIHALPNTMFASNPVAHIVVEWSNKYYIWPNFNNLQ